jgi:4-amino-4-deoxy-L-arabinose transferase-like glycosyltransferase
MYAYLDIIPVKLFGVTPFAARFPSAFFGVLTVLITYFLVKQLFFKSKHKEWYGLSSALILAMSPWHLMLSRAAFEANIATFFLVTGVWLFLYSMQQRKWLLPFSAISFVASMYTFNSARIVGPLLVIVLSIGFWKQLWQRKAVTITAVLVGILLVLPTTKFLLSPEAKVRFQEVNIFSDIDVIKTTNQDIANDNNALFSKIIHNRRIAYAGDFLQHYFDNLSPNFLFIQGDGNPKFSIQDVGQLYLWDIPFFTAGLLFLFKKREGNWWLIPLWLLLAIIPAATARETPHALRTEATLPMFQILSAYGLVQIISNFKLRIFDYKLQKSFIVTIFVLLFINVLYFQHDYYTHYPKIYSGEWQYGYQQSIAYAQSQYTNYDTIQVTQSLGRPYIYYLFFTQTDPKFFRQTAKISRDSFGFVTVKQFGKYHFVPVDKKSSGRTLFIDVPADVAQHAHVLKTFYLLSGQPVLEAYTL